MVRIIAHAHMALFARLVACTAVGSSWHVLYGLYYVAFVIISAQ